MTEPTADATPPPTGDVPVEERVARVRTAVRTWTQHLVDLGGRNTLLWYRDLPTGTLELTSAHPGGVAMLLAGRPTRLSDLFREQTAFEEARRRARAVARKTREMREERGIATGFVAIGMATWNARRAARPPAAPVLLRSCTLRGIGAGQQDFTIDLGQDVELNPVLVHYLRTEYALEVDADGLEDLATSSGTFNAAPTFAALKMATAGVVDAFEVAERTVAGNFSYAKLPMVADLSAQGDLLADHDVVAALAGDPTALQAVRAHLPEREAGDIDVDDEFLILDADSTQQSAIDAVRTGAHLVIKGPPGTGKSQTIANLVATLAADGKSVLFVAEKRAAIDAVADRLARRGLGDLVLDLHDGNRSRRDVATELGRALQRIEEATTPPTVAVNQREVAARRQALADHKAALHDPREPWAVTAHEAQEAVARLGDLEPAPRSRVRLRGDSLRAIDQVAVEELGRELTDAGARGAWATDTDEDPWYAARIATTEEAAKARELTARLAGAQGEGGLEAMARTMREVFARMRLPEVRTVGDWGRVLDTVGRVRDTLEVFRPEVFDLPLDDLVAATGTRDYRAQVGRPIGWWARRRLRKQARRLLRPGAPPPSLHDALRNAGEQRDVWRTLTGGGGRPELPAGLDRAEQTYRDLGSDLTWLGERLSPTPSGGDLLGTDLAVLGDRLARLDARPERLAVIPTVIGTLDRMQQLGLGPLVDDFAARGVEPANVRREVEFVWWSSLLEEWALTDPRYGAHDGPGLRAVVEQYAEADRRHLRDTSDRVRAAVGERLRQEVAAHPQQAALVRAEAGKVRRHRPTRDLITGAGAILTAIKPCWALSPLVVASVLPAGRHFDVVIFDEASQIPPAQAVSAISRARQVVVAGDERQLPPTSFFTAVTDAEDVADDHDLNPTEGLDSVLDVLAATLPTRRLAWHYRSRDERLIAFVNEHIYDGGLVTFPGALDDAVLRFEPVDGTGVATGEEGVETTTSEVDRVVELVLEHARTRPEESLGVIALGINHALRIQDALDRAMADAGELDEFFSENAREPFFVKNLERVQGDERDAIILSVGYGKTPHGRVLHRFGPLNQTGGERRLNVAITRARNRMTVVCAFTAADLDPARLKARGAVLLREYLAYAESGGARPDPAADVDGANADRGQSLLVADFARRLRARGLRVEERVGRGANPIDLAVWGDGTRPIAIEADGLDYAAMSSTRDRDRLRPEQLARLGWWPTQVWTTDLFRDPARDLARILGLVERAEADDPGADG